MHVRLRIEGRVQGVGFRWFVKAQAEALELSGTVRNMPDGSVHAEASGPEDALRRFVEAVRGGPIGSRVDAVREQWMEAGPGHGGFTVVR